MAATKFTDRWPEVLEMKIQGQQTHTRSGHEGAWVTISALPENHLIRCDYKGCVDGGFFIEEELDEAVSQRKTNGEAFSICRGKERMGRNLTRDCANHLRLKFEISYK